jgi:23S rRNA pseudouridine2605 synthase
MTRTATVRLLHAGSKPGRQVLEFVLMEGRNRQIRRMCAVAGLTVHRLMRVRVRSLRLGNLKPGQWRDLTQAEVADLRGPDASGMPSSEVELLPGQDTSS